MPGDAVRLGSSFTAPYVFGMGHWFKVSGISASGILAKMIEFEAVGDWPFERLIGKPMHVGSPELRVTLFVEFGLPLPTTIFGLPETRPE